MAIAAQPIHFEVKGQLNNWNIVYDGELQFKVDQAVRFRFPIYTEDDKKFKEMISKISLLTSDDVDALIGILNQKAQEKPLSWQKPDPRISLREKTLINVGLSSQSPLVRNHFRILQLKEDLRLNHTISQYDLGEIDNYYKRMDDYIAPLSIGQKLYDEEAFKGFLNRNDQLLPRDPIWDAQVRALAYADHPYHELMMHCVGKTQAPGYSEQQMGSLGRLMQYSFDKGDIPTCIEDRVGLNPQPKYPLGTTREGAIELTRQKRVDERRALIEKTLQSLEEVDREFFVKQITEEKE